VQARIQEIDRTLSEHYAEPDLGNVTDVFGELIYSLLSTRSAPKNYRSCFAALQSWCNDWKRLADASVEDIAAKIQICGLANRKARAISEIATVVFRRRGLPDLEHLRRLSTEEAEAFLMSLPEVGWKVAKCVSLYALERPSFPVDVHSLRVLQRLGIIRRDADARRDAREIESKIPPDLRRTLHINLVVHGRTFCGSKPKCASCFLVDACNYARRHGVS
jgi:endonuclease III